MIALVLVALAGLQSPALPASVPAGTRAFFERGPGYVPAEGIPETGTGGLGLTIGVYWSRRYPVPGYPGVSSVELHNTGSGYVEKFLLWTPEVAPGNTAPALVLFHAFGVSHYDALFNTGFLEQARRLGWYFIAPLGAFQNHHGCLESQINTQAVLEYLTSLLPIDRQRVFAVGFSMGGGAAASHAARHADPDRIRFAAIVDHTGSVCLTHAYANESVTIQAGMEARFGGRPEERPFEYRRCSTLELDPGGWNQGVPSDMSTNLGSTPALVWSASRDPRRYLLEESRAFYLELLDRGYDPDLRTVAGRVHSWSTMDEGEVCNWLHAQPALPTHVLDGQALADQDGNWFAFGIERDKLDQFTPVRWLADPGANRLNLTQTANLRRIHVDARDLELSYAPGSLLVINHSTADGQGDEIVLAGIPAGANPVVTLGGAPYGAVFDPQAGELTLPALDGAPHQWKVQF